MYDDADDFGFDDLDRQNILEQKWQEQLRMVHSFSNRLPPPVYVVEPILPVPSLNVVYGPPGSFKSLFVADAVTCIACGQTWLVGDSGGCTFPTTQQTVLWLDADNGRRRTIERFSALRIGHRVHDRDIPLHILTMPKPNFNASKVYHVSAIGQILRDVGARVLVLDNLGVIAGDVDENSLDIAHVMANFRHLAEDEEIAVVVIHHERKTGFTKSRAGDSLRGHSSIEASIDLALRIERTEGSESINVSATKSREAHVEPFRVRFVYEQHEDSTLLQSARFESIPVLNANDSKIDQEIKRALTKSKPNTGELVESVTVATGAGREKVRSRITELVNRKEIIAIPNGQNNATYYRLP